MARIDIDKDELIPITDARACRELPLSPTPRRLERWWRYGLKKRDSEGRAYLETVIVASRRVTTRGAFRRFGEEIGGNWPYDQ